MFLLQEESQTSGKKSFFSQEMSDQCIRLYSVLFIDYLIVPNNFYATKLSIRL